MRHRPNGDRITLRELFDERWRSHLRMHQAEEKVITEKEATQTERLEGMNKFRRQIETERQGYVTKEVLDARLLPLERLHWSILGLVGLSVIIIPIVVTWLSRGG